MVNSLVELILIGAPPALAALLVAGVGWLLQRQQYARWRRAALAGIALTSIGLGVFVYVAHSPDATTSRALIGTNLAIVATAVRLGMY
jgi:hypothetical protein